MERTHCIQEAYWEHLRASEIAYYALNIDLESLCYWKFLFHKNSAIIAHLKKSYFKFQISMWKKQKFYHLLRVVIFEIEKSPLKYFLKGKCFKELLETTRNKVMLQPFHTYFFAKNFKIFSGNSTVNNLKIKISTSICSITSGQSNICKHT